MVAIVAIPILTSLLVRPSGKMTSTVSLSFASLILCEKPKPAYIWVDDAAKISNMLSDIKELHKPGGAPLFIDLEGIDLCRNGTISIVQIHSEVMAHTFLVDVFTLGERAFDSKIDGLPSLKDVLEDARVRKVLFDVRADNDALVHLYGVVMNGVDDVQLMNVAHQGESLSCDLHQEARLIAYRWLAHCPRPGQDHIVARQPGLARKCGLAASQRGRWPASLPRPRRAIRSHQRPSLTASLTRLLRAGRHPSAPSLAQVHGQAAFVHLEAAYQDCYRGAPVHGLPEAVQAREAHGSGS
jgi:hypothetical protein